MCYHALWQYSTVLSVSTTPDVIKTADYIIDLGPEGGGTIIATVPEEVVNPASYTGQYS